MKEKFYVIAIVLVSFKGYSQFGGELFSFDYTLAPIGNDDVDFYGTNFKLSIPIQLKKGMLFNSLELNYYQLAYNNVNFITEDLNQFHEINYGLTYMYPMSDKWNINMRGGLLIASNLVGDITSNDLLFNGGITVIRKGDDQNKPSKLMLGLMYSTITGKQRILPFISYIKEVNDRFSFGIGFPNTFAKYTFNETHSLKTGLWFNGFNVNLSNPVGVDLSTQINKASFSSASLGLEYSYWMGDFWTITFKGGYSLYNNYELQDSENNTVYEFNTVSKPYFSAGFKFNIIDK
tara:strand:- start:2062 stop:2934 length:873 start_codon:yes stop_codon:yes gene_type:complete